MRMSWLTAFVILYIAGIVISLTLEGKYITSDEANVFHTLMKPEFGNFSNPLAAIGGFFKFTWVFLRALWTVLWWDYSFLTGPWEILRYVGWAGSIAMIYAIIQSLRGGG